MPWTTGDPDLRSQWTLDPSIAFLNHGSFGAAPRPVLEAQATLRAEMEREPVEFLWRRLPGLIDSARGRLARFLGADPDGLCFVQNATSGVNAVLRSLDFHPGDEIVVADHGYAAVKQAARYVTDRTGARFVLARVPFPLSGHDQIAAAYEATFSERTRLVIADHVTSPTALCFPVERIVAAARARGVPVLVDGAHAPAMLALDLDGLGADFYTGNLHKWLCAPKGAAFLQVAPRWRDKIHPLTISHFYTQGLHAEFDWTGTFDPTAWLAVPAAIDFFERLGPDAVRASNHALVQAGRRLCAQALSVELPHPDEAALYGPMAAIPFPLAEPASPTLQMKLRDWLFREHRVEALFTTYDERMWLRITGQVYNRGEDYERLAAALRARPA